MPRSRTARKKSSSKPRSSARTIRSRRIQRHVVKPATADEIIRGVGATAADLRIVDRILEHAAQLAVPAQALGIGVR